MATAVRDAYEALEADHDIELTPAYEYYKLEPENADQKLYFGFIRRALLSGIPAFVQQPPEPEVPAKLKINGELDTVTVEAQSAKVKNDEVILMDLKRCRQVNVIGHGIRKRLNQQLQLYFSDGRAILLRFTDMEHRHVCGHILPLLVDANRGWANSSWEDPEKVIGRDRRQVQTVD